MENVFDQQKKYWFSFLCFSPLLSHDDTQRRCKCSIDSAENSVEITEINGCGRNKKYTFDQVYSQQSSQESVTL